MAEIKFLSVALHEVALYQDQTVAPRSAFNASPLWDLLTSTRAWVDYILSTPLEMLKVLPSAFHTYPAYAMVILSTLSRLPSTSGWEGSMAQKEADFVNIGQRLITRYGRELSQTADDIPTEQKDVWSFFSRGAGGLMAWHQRCGKQGDGQPEYELPISSTSNNPGLRCTVADMMTSFTALRINRPIQPNHSVEHATQGVAEGLAPEANAQPDMVPDVWDDGVWQSILDDFSMFPTTNGFAAGSGWEF
jgi:hypothetical protein